MKKILISIAAIAGGAYLLICALVGLCPRLFFYDPSLQTPNLQNAHEYDYPAEEVKYKSADGTPLFAWFTPPHPGKKVIVFLHGNFGNIEEFYYKLKSFAYEGYGTMLPEYRGFGGIKGKINQKNLELDAMAAIRYLYSRGYKNPDIYVYGMSLGSHMAVHTAASLQQNGSFAGLILEVPFDNLTNVAHKSAPYLPLSLLIRDKYDNVEDIKQLKTPILIMGGSIDTKVPVDLAVNLYNQAPEPKKMIIYKNGRHGNLFNFRNDMDVLNWIEMNEKSIY